MTSQKANPRRATRRFLAAVDVRAREQWLAHDDRCGAVTGGCCNCTEWERFDWDRSVDDDDLCDCSEGLCAGFDGCRDEAASYAGAPPGRTCCGVPGCMGGCNIWAPTEARP